MNLISHLRNVIEVHRSTIVEFWKMTILFSLDIIVFQQFRPIWFMLIRTLLMLSGVASNVTAAYTMYLIDWFTYPLHACFNVSLPSFLPISVLLVWRHFKLQQRDPQQLV